MKPHRTGSNTAGVSDRIRSLLNYHTDLAKFAVNDELPVFWVLDLEDEKAVNVALGFKEREITRYRWKGDRDVMIQLLAEKL